jgi:hypothetical protein
MNVLTAEGASSMKRKSVRAVKQQNAEILHM